MVTRRPSKENEATLHDAGPLNSERAIERGTNKKWMESIKLDSDGEVEAAMEKMQLASENALERSKESVEEDIAGVDAALAVVNLEKEILEGYKDGLQRSLSAQQMGSRMAAEKEEAKEFLGGEKVKALQVRGDSSTAGKARAESGALEMAKGTFE